jgi:hypothetical protein
VPKLYLDLQSYTRGTVRELFSQVLTVASFAIFIPLRCRCSRNYSPWFGKNVTCWTQERYSPSTQGNCYFCYFCIGTTFSMGGGIRQVLKNWAVTYYNTTFCHRHLIMLAFYYSDQLNFVTVISAGVFSVPPLICSVIIIIQQMLKSWKQAFPVCEFETLLF